MIPNRSSALIIHFVAKTICQDGARDGIEDGEAASPEPDQRTRGTVLSAFRCFYIDQRIDRGAACNFAPNGVTRS